MFMHERRAPCRAFHHGVSSTIAGVLDRLSKPVRARALSLGGRTHCRAHPTGCCRKMTGIAIV